MRITQSKPICGHCSYTIQLRCDIRSNLMNALNKIFQTYIYLNVKWFVYISDKSDGVDNYFKCFVII